ncbi:MAG: tetratricopeptide repeat protein [Dysgonamonadaceae bacterium]|jgi:tetratricopeptide (TPR) repeat protein|nr:tetratricopeptide repeat protein [Dysgonamonadaceae bacterium]
MHTEKIIDLMRGNSRYDKKTRVKLSKIIEKYPYFQTAHLLHTLNLFHLEDTHFLYDLRKTAVYLNDRRKLFFSVENHFFDLDKIEALQHEIPQNADSVFNLIDSFLSEKEETFGEPEEIQDSPAVATDYFSRYLSEIREEKTENVKPLQFQDTIDRFLAKDEISPIKIELVDEQVKSQDKEEKVPIPNEEHVDDSDFFSETLAKIYIKQRKYDKALEIIRKIILFYPEKSSYFADQIQMLEDLVNINKNKTE